MIMLDYVIDYVIDYVTDEFVFFREVLKDNAVSATFGLFLLESPHYCDCTWAGHDVSFGPFRPKGIQGPRVPRISRQSLVFLGSKTSHWSILDLIGSHGSHSFQERMIQLLGDANPTFL